MKKFFGLFNFWQSATLKTADSAIFEEYSVKITESVVFGVADRQNIEKIKEFIQIMLTLTEIQKKHFLTFFWKMSILPLPLVT